VLTEPYFFGGAGKDIARVKSAVSLPVLRKDFIIHEQQIAETRALGADAVLLIAAVLKERLPVFVDLALEFGLEPLVEGPQCGRSEKRTNHWHSIDGINNRNLETLTIDRSACGPDSFREKAGSGTVYGKCLKIAVVYPINAVPVVSAFFTSSALWTSTSGSRPYSKARSTNTEGAL